MLSCNETKPHKQRIKHAGYSLYQGLGSRHIDIKIDSITPLYQLVSNLETNNKLYPTHRGWYIGYNDLMYSIAVHSDDAIRPLIDFYHKSKSNDAKMAVIYTLHLIGINLNIEYRNKCELFSNMNAREALFDLLAENDSLQLKIMMLLSRYPVASDVPKLFSILELSKSDNWGITCGLFRYNFKNSPFNQRIPESILYKKIKIKNSKDLYLQEFIGKAFKKISKEYKNSIVIEDTLLLDYCFEDKVTFSNLSINQMYMKNTELSINDLCDFCSINPFQYGSNFQYYLKDGKLTFCSSESMKRIWLNWWKSQNQNYKHSFENNNNLICSN